MDANVYKTRVKEVKEAFTLIEYRIQRIKLFDPEDVTLLDMDDYKEYLDETRKLLDEARDAAHKLCIELDISSVHDCRMIEEIYQLESNASRDCKNNARAIKNKVDELKEYVPGFNIGANPATSREAEKEAQEKAA